MSDSWEERASRVLLENYYPARLTLVRGEGCRVFDDEGRSYLDLIGGIAVNSLGHCHPAVVRAIREQCGTLMHVSNLYRNPWAVRLAEELSARVPGTRAFFCNSGAEANEAAIKLVRRHAHFTFGAARHVIISAEASFHGRTFAALTATGQPKYREGFEPLVPGFRYVPYGDLKALEAAVTDDVCAVLLEPIQGESGVRVPPPGYLAGAAILCAERGALLVFDEVQTGLGRTGTFLACEAEGVLPDVVTLSKSLGGGLPLGAMLARGAAAKAFVPGTHASTFGGNPVACAAALAFLETLDADKLLDRVRETGDWFMAALRGLASRQPKITGVRGRGLLIAIDLSVPAKPLALAAEERGYLVNAVQEQSLRFAPPFIVTREELAGFLSVLEEILHQG
ncbi:MAG: acetylornithine transaminase [Candidatus Methylomirabilia bacterium]